MDAGRVRSGHEGTEARRAFRIGWTRAALELATKRARAARGIGHEGTTTQRIVSGWRHLDCVGVVQAGYTGVQTGYIGDVSDRADRCTHVPVA